MNIGKFRDKHLGRFDILDFRAVYEFSTAATISFRLEKATAIPNRSYVMGWMDIHRIPNYYKEQPKIYLRIVLPDDYAWSDLKNAMTNIFDALEIPQDVIYRARLHPPSYQSALTSEGLSSSPRT